MALRSIWLQSGNMLKRSKEHATHQTAREPAADANESRSSMPYRILLIKDRRPGHFRKAEGIAKAVAREWPVDIEEITIAAPRFIPPRLLRQALNWPRTDRSMFRLFHVAPQRLQRPDLIISAGGETLALNVALARHFKCKNVFSGSIRSVSPNLFSAVIHTDPQAKLPSNHLVLLLPSTIDPDALRAPREFSDLDSRLVALLVGGPSTSCRYTHADWIALRRLVAAGAEAGVNWQIATSRRTPAVVADMFVKLATSKPQKISFIDYRRGKPGSADALFNADAILVTADSNTMIAEAVAARRPVVILASSAVSRPQPSARALIDQKHAVLMRISEATTGNLTAAIQATRPIEYNPLSRIASELQRLGVVTAHG
jgi:mitochondrial fission protein ELM1